MNNSFTTGPFPLGGGVKQGYPLSPYLFIIALKTFAINVRHNSNVRGLRIEKQLFGLKVHVNDEKTEIIPLGDNSLHEKNSQDTVFVK